MTDITRSYRRPHLSSFISTRLDYRLKFVCWLCTGRVLPEDLPVDMLRSYVSVLIDNIWSMLVVSRATKGGRGEGASSAVPEPWLRQVHYIIYTGRGY